jgi:hypothetical protein
MRNLAEESTFASILSLCRLPVWGGPLYKE